MTCVTNQDGSIAKIQKQILIAQAAFYQKLYQSNQSVEFTFRQFRHRGK